MKTMGNSDVFDGTVICHMNNITKVYLRNGRFFCFHTSYDSYQYSLEIKTAPEVKRVRGEHNLEQFRLCSEPFENGFKAEVKPRQ